MIDEAKQALESNSMIYQSDSDYHSLTEIKRYHPYTAMAAMLVPAIHRTIEKFDRAQVTIDLATTVCALERYWLDNGEYPGDLATLVPEYISEVPIDLMNGEPLHYEKREDGWFDLYSVGMNQVDDGGVFLDDKGQREEDEIDYPWPLPIPQTDRRLI
jgi:hypothetical protein